MSKIKVRMFKQHLCYLNEELLLRYLLVRGLSRDDLQSVIHYQVTDKLHLPLHSPADLLRLQEKVQSLYYDNVGEWLQDIMRRVVLASDAPEDAL